MDKDMIASLKSNKKTVLFNNLIAEMKAFKAAQQANHLTSYEFCSSAEFELALDRTISSDNYTAMAVLTIFHPYLLTIDSDKTLENWLWDLYHVALNKNFPLLACESQNPVPIELEHAFFYVLNTVNELQKLSSEGSFLSTYPFEFLTLEEMNTLENQEEYCRFVKVFDDNHIYSMMKINYELLHYTTLDHICGVHYLALHIARQLKAAGIPIDLGRVSGAAAGHDIGKFGCKGDESKRVAYLHYFYTGEWFDRYNMPYIKHIAVNHSTWDLELENLSVESLVLIYCDFCVKAPEDKTFQFDMQFYTLKESFRVILNKLDNVDEKKEQRYRKVYAKLLDFENFMLDIGITVDPHSDVTDFNRVKIDRPMYSLLHGDAITDRYKALAVRHNIGMMHYFRDESSMNGVLEQARSEDSHHRLRGYLVMFLEYYMYLTSRQKNILLSFLFERLTHVEEDIREECANMMGIVIASYDELHRKEMPITADAMPKTIDSAVLLESYFKKFLEADVATTPKHRDWIGHALGTFVKSLLTRAHESYVIDYTRIVLNNFEVYRKDAEAHPYLLRVLKHLPLSRCQDTMQLYVMTLIYKMAMQPAVKTRLEALDALRSVLKHINPEIVSKMNYDLLFEKPADEFQDVLNYMSRVIQGQLDQGILCPNACLAQDPSTLYLSNLKTATPPVIKRLQIDMLIQLIHDGRIDAFYAAMHFSNVLKVSAFQEVRERAGKALIEVFALIAHEQKNDIVIELLRALEIEGYQFTKYIPPYLGRLLNTLSDLEHKEIVDDLIQKMKSASSQICLLVLSTASKSLVDLFINSRESGGLSNDQIHRMFSVLLNGLVHYDPQVNQSAFQIIGHDLLGSDALRLDEKRKIYTLIAKKVMTIIANTDDTSSLTFMYYASALNHFYRFISDALHEYAELPISHPNRIAFFPGAFDPFSLAHKASACKIRDLGFEVYLAIDEFSWSKRTQANMIRRNIVKMSIADELDIYTFPRSFIVNLGNAKDINDLRSAFLPRDTYLVMGSDVLTHASAYASGDSRHALLKASHIIFERAQGLGNVRDDEKLEHVIKSITGDVIRLTLDSAIESISSTQIRTYIDEHRDISDLTEALVQKFIYEKGLYRREPQFKDIMTVSSLSIEFHDQFTDELIEELCQTFDLDFRTVKQTLYSKTYEHSARILVIRDVTLNGTIQACSIFHWLRSSLIHHEITSGYLTDYVQEHGIGRIIVIDGFIVDKKSATNQIEQVIITETLAFCLSKDYTYAIYRDIFSIRDSQVETNLKRNGFLEIADEHGQKLLVVNMSSPITLSLDCKAMIKPPYRNSPNVEAAINASRERLSQALCEFYPGTLVLSFDRTMIYEHLIKLVCSANNVPTVPTEPRKLGDAMLVPYGDVFKRWILPNTVTKALHTERYYNDKASAYSVKAFPNYLDLEIQTSTIKSFNRPVILVDDLLDKGYRLKAILAHFKRQEIPVRELNVAILSGRGKAWLEQNDINVKAAYFIPRIKLWFNESHLYPFIGGDALERSKHENSAVLPSINMVLPYVYPSFIKDVAPSKIANFSKVCLDNTYSILKALEREYLERHERNLTMMSLSEVLVSPRTPEKGHSLFYLKHTMPTDLLLGDIETMERITEYYTVGGKHA